MVPETRQYSTTLPRIALPTTDAGCATGRAVAVRRVLLLVAVAIVALVAVPAVAVAQPDPRAATDTARYVANPLFAFLGTLVVGGILLAAARQYTESVVEQARREAPLAFVWGIGLAVGFVVAFVVLYITVVGILAAIPLAIAFVVVSIVGSAVGYLALATWLLGDDEWVIALLAAAFVAGVTAVVPVLGGIVTFVVNSVGVGAIYLHYRGGDRRGRTTHTAGH